VDAATVRTEPSKKHHIRAWRLFRGYATQQELCNDIARNLSKLSRAFPHLSIGKTSNGFTRATLCRIENGTLRFNEDQLDVLAYMLKTTPGDLIKTDPFNSGSIFVIYSHLTAPQRKKLDDMAAKMIEPPK
jgi:hypothetical protein